MDNINIKDVVREKYGKIAEGGNSCCSPSNLFCGNGKIADEISKKVGYDEQDLKDVPEGANLGLGCGNPVAIASLKEGETVLDLGSGAGIDCFLAAGKVGKTGKVIGVDMTEKMIEKAWGNAKKGGYNNVEFRLGEIEKLPVEDSFVDVVISNCVINLSPDIKKVFLESYRVLKPGGRLMVSDIVLLKALPNAIKDSMEAYVGCIAGASLKMDYLNFIKEGGFKEVKIIGETFFPVDFLTHDPIIKTVLENMKISDTEINEIAKSVLSIRVSGIK